MSKKKVELSTDVQKLVNYYLEREDDDFNQLLNKALKAYIIKQLDSKQVQSVLKRKDDGSYSVNRLLHNSFNWMDEH